jgi:hypothetical protein
MGLKLNGTHQSVTLLPTGKGGRICQSMRFTSKSSICLDDEVLRQDFPISELLSDPPLTYIGFYPASSFPQ